MSSVIARRKKDADHPEAFKGQSFEDRLGEIIADYADAPLGEVISALEFQLEALREQEEYDE